MGNKKNSSFGAKLAKTVLFAGLILLSSQIFSHTPVAYAATCTNAQGGTYTADKCDGSDTTGSGIAYYLAQVVYVFTVGLGSVVAAVGAVLLNIAISFSLDSSAYNLDFISLGWTMLRDLANMAFIFILVYIALQVMFQAQTHGTVERLVKVLAVALIINFSFFATRVVIDAGNLVSVQFYNAIVQKTGAADTTTVNIFNQTSPGIPVPDITKKIMEGVNFQSALNKDSFDNVTGNGFSDFGVGFVSFSFIYITLGAMLFMLAAAFVAAAIKFLIRIVMLWFSIITAPLALVAWSFQGGGGHGGHGGGGYFSRWSKNLINHAIYPAVFLFVMLIISNFMASSGNILPGSISGQEGIGNLIMVVANIAVRLGFVLVMLYFALKASDYIEVAGSSIAKTWGNNFAFDMPASLMRYTVGGGSRLLTNVIPDKGAGKFARSLVSIPAKQSFDIRSLGTKVGVPESAIEKLGYGKPGGKGGFDERKHHDAGETKKAVDAKVKEINEHGQGAAAEIREQAKFQREYDRKYGTGALNRKVKELTQKVEASRHDATQNAKDMIAATTEAERKDAQDKLKAAQANAKSAETQLKAITGVGKRIVEDHDKQHKTDIAIKLMSSGKVRDYMVAQKILNGKSSAEKLKDAAKEAAKDDEESEKGGEAGGDSGSVAGGGGAVTTGGHA